MSGFVVLTVSVLLWAGMVLGVSFLASWAKFRTEGLDRLTALDVGQTVFGYFHVFQWGWWLMVAVLSAVISASLLLKLVIGLLLVLLASQTFVVFPRLKERVAALHRGETLGASNAHAIYGVLELMKLAMLIGLGVRLIV